METLLWKTVTFLPINLLLEDASALCLAGSAHLPLHLRDGETPLTGSNQLLVFRCEEMSSAPLRAHTLGHFCVTPNLHAQLGQRHGRPS